MNQEQNNFNQDNLNIPNNNGIPNLQPEPTLPTQQPTTNQNVEQIPNVEKSIPNPQLEPMQKFQQPIPTPQVETPTPEQPTTNQNVEQTPNVNKSISNQQPEPIQTFQQPEQTPQVETQITEQPISNSFQNEKVNNQNFNNKPPKNKKKLGLVIGIVAVVAVALITSLVGIFYIFKNESNSGSSVSTSGNSLKNSNIKQISITGSDVIALTNEGDLYYIGETFSILGTDDAAEKANVTKKASNVEKIYNNGTAVYFIDDKSDLYYFGSSYNGGSSKEIEKDYTNVKDLAVYMNLCGFVIKNNNELYAKNLDDFCGFKEGYNELTKVADNVKETFVYQYYNGYINKDNELYLIVSYSDNHEYEKIMDNVNSVISYSFFEFFILTNDNKLYFYDGNYDDDNKKYSYELKLLREDVEKLYDDHFVTTNGEYIVFDNDDDLCLIKGESKVLYEDYDGRNKIYYGTLKANNIKEILYYINSLTFDNPKYKERKKLIYVSNDNEIVMVDKHGEKKLPYNIKSIKEIYKFVLKSDLVERD